MSRTVPQSVKFEHEDLVKALEQNEFDIAGLVDFFHEQAYVDQCLRQLFRIIRWQIEPDNTDKNTLAQVLFGMLYVARNDYAAAGHQEYWPFLFDRIQQSVFAAPEKFWSEALSGPQSQALLGRWFKAALDAFGYSIPNGGQRYVGPIVFHAGIPTSSLPRAMSVIAAACDQFGTLAISLPADIRAELVANHPYPLHRNVRRLLSSNLQGAAQLWGCLARVVLAWKTKGDCNDELQQLPLALDPDEVRTALPSVPETRRAARSALPQLRYDPETGEIRLTFPGDATTNWLVTSPQHHPIDLAWSRTHRGQTADFKGPFPEQISVKPSDSASGIERVFTPYPSEWPGFWFHAYNGNLEDGLSIDASGLSSGRWYVIFEGTPTKCSVPYIAQVPLKWSWFKGNECWTAWEVEVPPRTNSQSYLEWYVGDNCFRVPLARRPGPRVEFIETPIVTAKTQDGNQVDVYADAPSVVLRRDQPISLQLLKETTDSVSVVARFDLPPETATRLPVAQAGIYQLRESRGVGRTLLRFAIVPDLAIQGPEYDTRNLNATVRISADSRAGQISDDEGLAVTRATGLWNIRSSTVKPNLKVRWCWSSDEFPHLTFSWPLEALRWRITGAGDEYSEWTREPLFISPNIVRMYDAQLEIQTPIGSDLLINGNPYTGRIQAGPTGNTCVISLFSYGETIELENECQRYTAVLQTERPLIDSLQGASDTESLIITWQSTSKQTGMVVAAWAPCDLLSSPKVFSLSTAELESCEWVVDCNELPGRTWTSISLARSTSGFFQKALHLATRRSETLEPVTLLLNRSTGEVRLGNDRPITWAEFLHYITLLRLNRKPVDCETIAALLSDMAAGNDFDLSDAVRLLADLDQLIAEPATNDRDRSWAQALHQAVLTLVHRVCRDNPDLALSGNNSPEVFPILLKLGIPIGRYYPLRWVASGQQTVDLDKFIYPLTYICALWLLGTGRKLLEYHLNKSGQILPERFAEMQLEAASRVLDFHEKLDLPSITAFLPLSRRTARTALTDQGHHHSFAFPTPLTSIESLDQFCGVLGIDDKALDCRATCDDQFFHVQLNSGRLAAHERRRSRSATCDYSLYWSADESQWAVETPYRSPPTCCFTNLQPLIVDPIPARELANAVIFESLVSWTSKEIWTPEQAEMFKFLGRYKETLVSDPISGPLHAELFKPSELETKVLFGRTVQVETHTGLPGLAVIAWQLAWLDRITAWEGENAVFDLAEDKSAIMREFLYAFGVALDCWPMLMKRTIALAELVYWTLYRGGLGTAVRFRCDRTEQEMRVLRTLRHVQKESIASSTSAVTSTGECARTTSGVIVGYDAGIGVILLHCRNFPSLEATFDNYVTHGAERHRFARFKWRSLPQDTRDRIQKIRSYDENHKNHSGTRTLADVMCGMRVNCTLRNRPGEETDQVDVDFSVRKSHLPKHRRRHPG